MQITVTLGATDPKRVAQNRRHKRLGSYGLTVISTMPSDQAAKLHRLVQEMLACKENISCSLQVLNGGIYGLKEQKLAQLSRFTFVPIKNLHTTITAGSVIDAQTPLEFYNKQFARNLILAAKAICTKEQLEAIQAMLESAKRKQTEFGGRLESCLCELAWQAVQKQEPHAELVYSAGDPEGRPVGKVIQRLYSSEFSKGLRDGMDGIMRDAKPIALQIESLKLTSNGSLIVQWPQSPEMALLRQKLAAFGCCSKSGFASPWVNSTLGFFPHFATLNSEQKQLLVKLIQNASQKAGITTKFSIKIRPSAAKAVSFAVNSLRAVRHFKHPASAVVGGHYSGPSYRA